MTRDKARDGSRTRQNLLEAAGDTFAEKGFREATVAEICRRAGANIAAVNYHFGSKRNLYVEAWRHCLAESLAAHPPEGGVRPDAPPEERLRGLVGALLFRIADENNREFLIMIKERANPTGLLLKALEKELRQLGEGLESVLRELLGPQATDAQLGLCVVSVISQCLDPMAAARARMDKRTGKGARSVVADLEAYAEHVTEFSLAGIRAVAARGARKRPAAWNPRGAGNSKSGRKA